MFQILPYGPSILGFLLPFDRRSRSNNPAETDTHTTMLPPKTSGATNGSMIGSQSNGSSSAPGGTKSRQGKQTGTEVVEESLLYHRVEFSVTLFNL